MEEKSNLKSKKFNQKSYLYGMYKNKFYPVINFEELLNFEEELTLKKQYFEFEKQFKLEEKNIKKFSSGKENPVTKIMESATRLSSIQKEVKDYFLSKEFNEKVKDLISKFLERYINPGGVHV